MNNKPHHIKCNFFHPLDT